MTYTTFTVPSHWVIKPTSGTLDSMQTDEHYREEMIRLHEKANEFYREIAGNVGEVDEIILETTCMVFAYEALVPETATTSWQRFLKKEAAKFRKKLNQA